MNKMKKFAAWVLAAAMLTGLTACGGGEQTADAGESTEKTHIYVLTAAEDHGWTGSVATFAKEKVAEINEQGKYSAEVITASDAAEQITKLEGIIIDAAAPQAVSNVKGESDHTSRHSGGCRRIPPRILNFWEP